MRACRANSWPAICGSAPWPIWADESRFAYNTDWQEGNLTGACAACPYRRVCQAGCTSLAYSVTGSIYENPYCLHRLMDRKPAP